MVILWFVLIGVRGANELWGHSMPMICPTLRFSHCKSQVCVCTSTTYQWMDQRASLVWHSSRLCNVQVAARQRSARGVGKTSSAAHTP